MQSRRIAVFAALVSVGACQNKATKQVALPTVTITRGDIAVRVQATGTVEPINPVDIKSKAQGMIIKMPVEVGSVVKRGDLLAQVDPRDVKNQFDQAMADDVVASAGIEKAIRDRARKDTLFARHVITQSEHDSTKSTFAMAQSQLVSAKANLDLARQRLEDASVEAPIGGTIVSRPVTQGQIITAATSANGGTTLMTVADLGRVRMRVTIDEVEMGNIRVGLPASVAVDAFPDRTFDGVIEKIEPQAVVTQGVTFFPVMVSINNKDGLLMPGMNGEVTIRAADLSNVVQVPIDASRPTGDVGPGARMCVGPLESVTGQRRCDLVPAEGGSQTGPPGKYLVAGLADGADERWVVRAGPSDLRVVKVAEGLQPGD